MSIGILPNVNSIEPNSGCKTGDECLFPHHEVDEQPDKKPKKSDHSTQKEKATTKNAVAMVKFVSQRGCVSQDSELLDSQRGKRVPVKPDDNSLGIRKVRFALSTLRQASIQEKKGPSLGKIQVKNPHQ